MGNRWTHKVVKVMRGVGGRYFDFPTAGTFGSETGGRAYAEAFAREQGAVRVSGARIEVRTRGGTTVAVYRSEDYLPAEARAERAMGAK